MKELLVSFMVCLVIGAVVNGMSQSPPAATMPPAETTPAPGTEPPVAGTIDNGGNEAGTSESGSSTGSEGTGNATGKPQQKALDTSDSAFEQDVLKSELPVLVDFNASWCVPCQRMAPVVDRLAQEYEGKVKVYKVDTDRNPELMNKYQITALPTFMVFRQGRSVSLNQGAVPQEVLASAINRQLGTTPQ